MPDLAISALTEMTAAELVADMNNLFTTVKVGTSVNMKLTTASLVAALLLTNSFQPKDPALDDLAAITFAKGDVLYYNGSNLVKLSPSTNGFFLKTQGVGADPIWASVGSGLLPDGDKGDITVSGSGATWVINPDKVDFTKIQNVATGSILGRQTAATGDVEALTGAQATALLSIMTGASSGAAGLKGLVPQPQAGDQAKFLRGDGTWVAGSATVAWGSITGTLSSQTDLQSALDGKQPLNANLTALAGLTLAADKLPYATGAGALALTDFSAFARTLLDDGSASVARTTLGVAIGSNVQAWDADLDRYAATGVGLVGQQLFTDGSSFFWDDPIVWPLDGDKGDITVSGGSLVWTIDAGVVTYAKIQNVSAQYRLLGRTSSGAGSIEEITTSSYIVGLLDDANAAAAQSTLGLVPGTNVQAQNARLSDIAGISYVRGDIIFYNGSNLVKLGAGAAGAPAKYLRTNGTAADPTWEAIAAQPGEIPFIIDGGNAVITTGIKGDIYFSFACTLTANTLLADASGSIVIDLWKVARASYPPTVVNTITASAKPTLSSQDDSQDTTLTGWTVAINAGDVIRVNVDSASTVKRVTLSLSISKPMV